MGGDDLLDAFRGAALNKDIVAARFAVLDSGAVTLTHIADMVQISGELTGDDRERAVALLTRLAAELSGGIATLSRQSLIYAAGTLLRQLVEIEYLMYLGYKDPDKLARWFRADGKELRRWFSPKQMRNESEGLFRDEEYWLHCELGGHPNPRAHLLLSAYQGAVSPIATVLPDSVQHLRRLWTSLRLLLPGLGVTEAALDRCASPLTAAIEAWVKVENPMVKSLDGIPRDSI